MARQKRRNSEKRKEKSRDAARCRRGKECEIFNELAQALPLAESMSSQLDKASVMRLTISYLKIDSILQATDRSSREDEAGAALSVVDKRWDHLYQKALDGFAFILSHDGDIVYLTESVGKYLGLQQIELIGQSIYDFTHPCDHEEIGEMLSPRQGSDAGDHDENRMVMLRLKCTLTSKGRNVNLKSASYKPMKFTGRLLVRKGPDGSQNSSPTSSGSSPDSGLDLDASPLVESGTQPCMGFPFLVGVAEPIPHPSNIEVPLDSRTFLSKHGMDMHFLFCDDRIKELAGFNSEEMIGQSMYDFHHGLDSEIIEKAFKNLFSKGQAVTEPYRFLAKTGGYMWVVTQATVINNSRTMKPQSVVCVHYVVSDVEKCDQILSHVQEQQQLSPPQEPAAPKCGFLLDHLPPKVELSTENIFAPKTKDMNESYFVPPELKDSITFLNEEPADLSYLAPDAGDDFLPVVFLDRDTLLSPDLTNLKPDPDNIPDMTYRSNLSPVSYLSSNPSSRISSPKEYLNMNLPGGVVAMDTFFQSMTNLKTADTQEIEGEDGDAGGKIDFAGRAPYIPMDSDHDLGLCPPSSNVLFTLPEDLNPGVYGKTEQIFGSKHTLFEEPPQPPRLSMQDMLGGSTAVASIKQPPDTMHLQMKRPLDMNSLEKGPPNPKLPRLGLKAGQTAQVSQLSQVSQSQQRLCGRATGMTTLQKQQPRLIAHATKSCGTAAERAAPAKDSVLLNLLLSGGNDRNYNIKPFNQASTSQQRLAQQLLLPNLTSQECEVNAPASTTHLLQGNEIQTALEGIPCPGLISLTRQGQRGTPRVSQPAQLRM